MRNLRTIVSGGIPITSDGDVILANLGFARWTEFLDYWTDVNQRVTWARKKDLEDLQARITKDALSGPVLAWRGEVEEILASDKPSE
jgi:hypothetical protein